MRRDSRSTQRGFTVLEALVSLLLFVVVLTAALSIYTPSRMIYAKGEIRTDVQQNARLAMSEVARQIRMAGFFPENFGTSPADPPLENPILIATDEFFAFHGDADGSDASAAFTLCLDEDKLRLGRAATTSTDVYGCVGEILAENVLSLQLTYYDAAGDPVPDPPSGPYALDSQNAGSAPTFSDTSQRESIRRVVITLTAQAPTPKGEFQTYHLTSDAWLRNGG